MKIRCAFIIAAAVLPGLYAQTGKPGDWPSWNHDSASTRYSTLKQIDRSNVSKLAEAWTFTTRVNTPAPAAGTGRGRGRGRGGPGGIGAEVTPIVVNGVMYAPAGNLVVAINPDEGKEIWRYQLPSGQASSRGVAYWPGDKENPPRIVFTSGRNLVALNADTGKLDPGFGKEGMVDMVVGYGGVPTIFKNTVMVGASVLEVPTGPPGDTRAYDARTGANVGVSYGRATGRSRPRYMAQ